MRAIILGHRGQLGSDIVKALERANVEVVGIDRSYLDAAAPDVWEKLSALPSSDFIINCMAFVNVDGAESSRDLAMQVNAAFPYFLARHAERTSAVLIHISTDFVFAGNLGRSYVEDDLMTPINFYGLSKASGESAIRGTCQRHFIIRVSGLYGISGSGSKGGNFVETMIRKGSEIGQLKVVSDQFTTPTHTTDVARVVLHLMRNRVDVFGTYHCASVNRCSWYEFASEIVKRSGVRADVEPIQLSSLSMIATRPLDSSLETAKLQRMIELPTWQNALEDYFAIRNSETRS